MEYTEITAQSVKALMPQRPQQSNKGTFGKVLNIAGSIEYQGAAYLSSVAPLKTGAGLVTLATIEPLINNLAGNCPWVTFYPLRDYYKKCIASDAFGDVLNIIENYNVLSVGPGLSDTAATNAFVDDLIKYLNKNNKKTVIDADAINVLSKSELSSFPSDSVITPHPVELSRLINTPVKDIQNDRIKYAKLTAEKFGCCVVLKGNQTVVCTKDLEVFVNTSGNSALAKAGSGDVLTGIISGLMAQGVSVENAAKLGVYLHGLCGELASQDLSLYSVLATDQIDYIPQAIKKILEA
ncbi:aDP-dependent (S)-NAD(P)H-hydrate dehydratase [Clostridium sp. CAG:306]|nr:aDP-dependent (S)-NAD(P)H-hydrate dehydratase [Clostridium sp. CAG:306]